MGCTAVVSSTRRSLPACNCNRALNTRHILVAGIHRTHAGTRIHETRGGQTTGSTSAVQFLASCSAPARLAAFLCKTLAVGTPTPPTSVTTPVTRSSVVTYPGGSARRSSVLGRAGRIFRRRSTLASRTSCSCSIAMWPKASMITYNRPISLQPIGDHAHRISLSLSLCVCVCVCAYPLFLSARDTPAH